MYEPNDNNTQLSINKYFQDSSNSDIFDQISKLTVSNEFDDLGTTSQTQNESGTKEPVICRIFASEAAAVEEIKTKPAESFFDNLGIGTGSQSLLNVNMLSSTTQSTDFSRDVSLLSPSSDLDIDAVNDELFMKGATSVLSASSGSSGEVDRRRDAWIPCARTRQALAAAATALPGTFSLETDLMTMPGVLLQEDMIDNVHEAVNHYLGEAEAAQRKVLSLNDVTQDERGLRELIQAECYRAAVNLTSRLLTMYGQGVGRAGYPSKHTLHSIQLWFTRIALLVKLRSWSVAWAESEPWWNLDRPDLYFQFYSELYGGRPGSIVPFSFRLLLAELPQYVHKPQEAFKRLFSVLTVVRNILKNLSNRLSEDGSNIEINDIDRKESMKLWESREIRVLHSIINLAFQQKDFRLACNILRGIINNLDSDTTTHHRRALMSAMGRIFLQLGDLSTSMEWFDRSKQLKNVEQNRSLPDFLELVDCGLLAIANDNYDQACDFFKKASMKDPTNIMVKNNIAVCLLYCGKQKEAVNLLEAVIDTNPASGLHESLLLNLCTLYELESSSAVENKYKMLRLVSKYKGDAISLHCLKLQIKE